MSPLKRQGAFLLERFIATFAVLAAAGSASTPGLHKLSAWWRETIAAFLLSNRRQLVARVGRRGGKSSTLCVLAVVVALYGTFAIPLGDVGIVAIVSATREQAGDRLRTIETVLRTLGVNYRRVGDTLELAHRPIIFRVYTASISGVVGGTIIFALCDELALWRDLDSGVNPASEVLPALRAAMASQPTSLIVLASAPMSVLDAHYDAFELGETEFQAVAHAETWRANPSITETETHALEPNLRNWTRAFAARPVAAIAEVIPDDAREDAFRPRFLRARGARVMLIDPAKGRGGDSYTSCFAGWAQTDEGSPILMHDIRDPATDKVTARGVLVALDEAGRTIPNPDYRPSQSVLVISDLAELAGDFATRQGADDIADRHARECRAAGVHQVWGDQYEALGLEAAYRRAGQAIGHPLTFNSITWGNANKGAAVERLRALFMARQIQLPPDEKLKREIASFSERILPSGQIRFSAAHGHDDFVMLLVLAAGVDLSRSMSLSPIRQSNGLTTSGGGWGTLRENRRGY